MQFIPLRAETIIPAQEIVALKGAEVDRFTREGRIELARFALLAMINAGTKIDYETVGRTDGAAYDYVDSLESNITSLSLERNRLQKWMLRQNGVDVTNKPKVLSRILTTQKRVEQIDSKYLPQAETALEDFLPTAEETSDIAELTGHAWPYYPELFPLESAEEHQSKPDNSEQRLDDAAIRIDIHNIISRLSYDRKGGLGVRYNTLTAYFFNELDTETKSIYAKALAAMIRSQEVRIWTEDSIDYIESSMVQQSAIASPEKKVKPIVIQIDIDEAHTREFIQEIIRKFGADGYKRIESGESLELQVPHAFASAYAEAHGLILSKNGPSRYRFLSN